ncbi:hypothetical protein FHS96_000034 [Sphingomonas zeicaulis]|uniref:CPBP family intramembrane glutamic endopeptidase n=1 Tax=Sphingomonas zeicaulis TaxID=1632740 RepID=UPI003D1A0AC5
MKILKSTPARCLAVALLIALLFGPLNIPYRVLVLAFAALIWVLLEARELRPIGLGRQRLVPTLMWGGGVAIGVVAAGLVYDILIEKLMGVHSDLSGYGALAGNAEAALKLLGLALTSAAFGEEILFRGFLLYQLSELLGTSARSRWIAILLGGALFGLGHFIQGANGIITTGLVGVVFGWAWFRSGRNLWAMILAHALIDSFGIGMLYLGWA